MKKRNEISGKSIKKSKREKSISGSYLVCFAHQLLDTHFQEWQPEILPDCSPLSGRRCVNLLLHTKSNHQFHVVSNWHLSAKIPLLESTPGIYTPIVIKHWNYSIRKSARNLWLRNWTEWGSLLPSEWWHGIRSTQQIILDRGIYIEVEEIEILEQIGSQTPYSAAIAKPILVSVNFFL